MKAKKTLFLTSGILKLVACGISFLLFFIISLLVEPIVEGMIANPEIYNELINEMATIEPAVLQMDAMQIEALLLNTMNTVIMYVLLISLFGIVFGIFNVIFAKKYDKMLAGNTGKKVTFMIFEILFYPGLITNVLSIVALFLRDDKIVNNNTDTTINSASEAQV